MVNYLEEHLTDDLIWDRPLYYKLNNPVTVILMSNKTKKDEYNFLQPFWKSLYEDYK